MNKDFYEQLMDLVSGPHNFLSNLSKCQKFRSLKDWIYSQTDYLFGDDTFYTLGNRIFYILNNFKELPKCANPNCTNIVKVNFTVYTNKEDYYHVHCCGRCVQLDPLVKNKIEKTTLSRYNCRRGRNDAEVCDKRRKTCMEKFGYVTPLESVEIRNKCKRTLIDRYGVESSFKIPEVREKIRETFQEKYGVDNPFESKKIQTKIENTNLQRYGFKSAVKSPEIRKKVEDSMYERYGSTSYLGTDECLEKTKITSQKKYGVDYPSSAKEVRDKIAKTNLERYGNVAGKSFDSLEVMRTMKERYGGEHASHCPSIQKMRHRKYFYDNQYFDSGVEIAFYIWLKDVSNILNLDFCYSPSICFDYYVDNEIHHYNPDFDVNGILFEIKGGQFLKDGIMVNPYTQNLPKDIQDSINKRYEAKYNCMVKNNIIILTYDTYKFFIDYVKQNYGRNYIKQFKV